MKAATTTLTLRVGCEFTYDVAAPTPTLAQVRPRTDASARLIDETWSGESSRPPEQFVDIYGNTVRRWILPAGLVQVGYDARVEVPDAVDADITVARQQPVEDLPDELLHYTLPSRYCLSDTLMSTAWEKFGHLAGEGGHLVQAISDWVHGNLQFQYGASDRATTSADAYRNGRGVCRDFAHLGVTFCRAMNVPARYVFGYIPDIDVPPSDSPMDFCAWAEAWIGDRWWTFDPRNNTPRIGRVLIGRGRDALDVAMMTTYGPAEFKELTVWADTADLADTTEKVDEASDGQR